MHCVIGVFQNAKGHEQVRLVFPEWQLSDGTVLHSVSIHPHLCGTCVGGDHTHVEMNDERMPARVLKEDDIELSAVHVRAINRLLREKLRVDGLTRELATYVEAFETHHV